MDKSVRKQGWSHDLDDKMAAHPGGDDDGNAYQQQRSDIRTDCDSEVKHIASQW